MLKSGVKTTISGDKAYELWRALQRPSRLSAQQRARVDNVQAVWLDWHTAPDEYVRYNLEWIIPLALHEWTVDGHGKPLKPQDAFGWDFARRWGLWEHGAATVLVRSPGLARALT